MAVHRIIEQRVSTHGDRPAIVEPGRAVSYRELNIRANTVARHLMAYGFRRGGLVVVRLPRSPSTAIVLLAILKAGGTYVLIDENGADVSWPAGISMCDRAEGDEARYVPIDLTSAFDTPCQSCPNLPIHTRESDVACVIPDRDGAPSVHVPHSTIASLRDETVPPFIRWVGEPGALDLWMALMTGATVSITAESMRSAA
jgi:non-ribosomal peptide synthetase component F